jgi:hypothetical protein
MAIGFFLNGQTFVEKYIVHMMHFSVFEARGVLSTNQIAKNRHT